MSIRMGECAVDLMADETDCCAVCFSEIVDGNEPEDCIGCGLEGCSDCCIPLCDECSEPLTEVLR